MTDLLLPKIALGAWAWGNDGTFGDTLTESDLRPVFDASMDCGLTLWDNAYVYGMGASEKVMGKFLRTVLREKYQISAKFTPQCANLQADNAVIEMYQTSANLLGTDKMDFYWIHNPVGAPKWIKELIPLAKTGKIGKIGVSNHNLAEIKQAQEILLAEGLTLSAVQNHYSLINRSSEASGILDYCKENNMIFFSYMVLEQGALTGAFDTKHPFPKNSDRGQVYNPLLPQLEILNGQIKEIADKYQVGIPQISMAWAIAKGTLPIIGATKTKHVYDAKKASEIQLNSEDVEKLEWYAQRAGLNTIRYWEKEMK
ncbi:MAG: aldo/keto reductase [Proteobacteria bacterium]|nr:aldo/keto reductase [Pseudomonadota bacterium]